MTKNTELIVLAGGKGSRLGSLTQSAQKCALEISGKPFLIHVLGQYLEIGINHLTVLAGFRSSEIVALVAHIKSKYPYVFVEVITESTPLGTGGALSQVKNEGEKQRRMLINGDTYIQNVGALFNILSEDYLTGYDIVLVNGRPRYNEGEYGIFIDTPKQVGWVKVDPAHAGNQEAFTGVSLLSSRIFGVCD